VQDVYRFIGVNPDFVPDFDAPHNVGGIPESRLLEGLFTNKHLKSVVQPWIPKRAANWVRRLRMRNMRQHPPLPAELRRELTSHFRADIKKTSELIGRSLDHWF